MRKAIKILAKVTAATIGLMITGMFIAWLTLNIAMGCGMVNDWNHPSCMTPAEMFLGE